MYQWSLSQLQGVSTQRGTLTRRTTQDQASRSSRLLSRGSMCNCLCHRGAPLWAWLLLGVLVLPGAWSFLSEEQEELLVELHNHYRGQVSPSASAMLPLKWDPSLKLLAEGYATKCIWNHNPELEDTGENLFAGDGPLDLREALEKWFLEHLDYDYQNNSCDEDKMCGHYTQMVWADTHRVGCAFHICNSMEGLDWERVSFLVCNYYPAGNYEEVRPYVEGDWCSRCPENLQKCENNLCVADTVDEEDDGDWWTPPPATSNPSLPPEVEDNGEVFLSPTPTDVQPEAVDNDLTDTLVPDTPSPGEPATLGEEENVGEEMDKEVEEEEEQEVEKEEEQEKENEKEKEKENEKEKQKEKEKEKEERMDERKETVDKVESGWEKDVTRKAHKQPVSDTTGLVSSLLLLVACLTGILTLRL